jgi:glycine dehydrogenase subunit 1
VKRTSSQPFLNEFIVEFSVPIESVLAIFRQNSIEPGIPLERYESGRVNQLLIAVTETKSKEQLDHYIKIASMIS